MTKPIDLAARLEGSTNTVTLSDGTVISYRHLTKEQNSAAMARAGVDPKLLLEISEAAERGDDDVLNTATLEQSARMSRAHELCGGYCIVDCQPRPELPSDKPWRERDEYGLLCLSDAALMAMDPYASRLGEHLFSTSNLSKSEGED